METTPKVTISLDEYNELLNIKKASNCGDLYFADRHYSLYDDGFNGKIYGKKELQEFFKENCDKLEKKDKDLKDKAELIELMQKYPLVYSKTFSFRKLFKGEKQKEQRIQEDTNGIKSMFSGGFKISIIPITIQQQGEATLVVNPKDYDKI